MGKELFEQCILRGLDEKLVILITNQLSVVPRCSKVLVLESVSSRGGAMVDFGTYADIMSRGLDFASMMERFGLHEKQADNASEAGSKTDENMSITSESLGRARSTSSGDGRSRSISGAHAKGAALMQKEEREVGAVPFSAYVLSFVFCVPCALWDLCSTVGDVLPGIGSTSRPAGSSRSSPL